MKQIITILMAVFIIAACTKQEPIPENYNEVIKKYLNSGKSDSALVLIDRVLSEIKDLKNEDKVNYNRRKLNIFLKAKDYAKALPIAIEVEKMSERKSPYRVLPIAECYLRLDNPDKALEAVNKMITLGFKDKSEFDNEPFNKIKELEVFPEILKKIDENIGIDKAAKDFTLTDVDGNEYTLSKLKGKVVLVDFWATWCPPCRKEIPLLVEYYNELNKKGFEILGISLDPKNTLEDVKKFMEKEKMEWPVFYSGKGWFDDTSKMHGVNSIPSTWLIDKKGVLRYFALHGEDIKIKVEELLTEK